MEKQYLFWQTYLNLEKELLELSKYIFITDRKSNSQSSHQLDTYSPHIADLLVRCCVEIEAISKDLYFQNGGSTSISQSQCFFDTVCLRYLDSIWGLQNKIIHVVSSSFDLELEENKSIKPLLKCDKRSKSLWIKNYQAVKHDRYNSIHKGTIKALIQAMAALYLLNIYNRNIKLTFRYNELSKLDYSFGSSVFSIEKPTQEHIVNVINGIGKNEVLHSYSSPYILKYTKQTYKELLNASIEIKPKIVEFLNKQKEFRDPNFASILQKRLSEFKGVTGFVIFEELFKYRINNEIPSSLPFLERKKQFVSSTWWSSKLRTMNKHLLEHELNENNIQDEIDLAGHYMGMEVANSFEAKRISIGFNTGMCELVLDRGDVCY